MRDVLLLGLAMLACWVVPTHADENGEWRKAARKGTRSAYEEFLRRNSHSAYASAARDSLEGLAFTAAESASTVAAWEEFLHQYSGGHLAELARTRLAQVQFETACSDSAPDGFEAVIRDYPTTPWADSSRSRLARFEFSETPDSAVWVLRFPANEATPEARMEIAAEVGSLDSLLGTVRTSNSGAAIAAEMDNYAFSLGFDLLRATEGGTPFGLLPNRPGDHVKLESGALRSSKMSIAAPTAFVWNEEHPGFVAPDGTTLLPEVVLSLETGACQLRGVVVRRSPPALGGTRVSESTQLLLVPSMAIALHGVLRLPPYRWIRLGRSIWARGGTVVFEEGGMRVSPHTHLARFRSPVGPYVNQH